MEIRLASRLPSRIRTGVLGVALSGGSRWRDRSQAAIDLVSKGAVERLMLLGTATAKPIGERDYHKLCHALGRARCRLPIAHAWIRPAHEVDVADRDVTPRYHPLSMAKNFTVYRFTLYQSREQLRVPRLKRFTLLADPGERPALGSRQAARLIILNYRGATGSSAALALIGKGVTFDSGAMSIESAQSLDERKVNMCGAALRTPGTVSSTLVCYDRALGDAHKGLTGRPRSVLMDYIFERIDPLRALRATTSR